MKTALKLMLAAALFGGFASCKTFKDLSKQKDGDDVYFSQKDAKKERAAEKKRREAEEKKKAEEEAEQLKQANNAKAMATSPGTDYYDQPFDYDDYYDYEYAARLRRFNNPIPGAGYYGNYYTNSYFYNQNPYYYGTSVYNSYNFWGPSAYAYNYCPQSYYYYNSGWAWGTGMNYGMYNGFYDPWMNNGWGYNPYYSCGGGWNGGWYGPSTMFIANYWGGPGMGFGYGNGNYGYGNNYGNNNNNYYFNSYDENSYYYGPRNTPTASDGRAPGSGGPAFGERYANAVGAENGVSNPGVDDVNRVTQQSYAAAPATQPDSRNNSAAPTSNGSVPPAPSFNNSGTRTDGNANSTPAAPDFSNSNSGSGSGSGSTPSSPNYSAPANTTSTPAPSSPSRTDGGSSPSYSAPSNNSGNNGGSNSGGSRSGNSGGNNSGSRPR